MKHLPSSARRSLTLLAAGTVAALALAGCSSGGTDASGDSGSAGAGSFDSVEAALEKGGEITYWSWTPSAEAQVAAFQKEYPNVKVNLVNAGTNNEEYTKLQNAIKAGSGAPDVVQVEYYAFPQFALTDAFADLAPYGFADFEDDYTASTWNSVTSGDAIYGLPQDSGPMALFYNKAVFDAAGVEVPTTWDQYYEAAKTIHAANPDTYITNDTGDAGFATSMIWPEDSPSRRPAPTSPSICRMPARRSGPRTGTASSRRTWSRRTAAGATSGSAPSATAASRPS
jgi:multiple sugar transport system substrate-binding protein